MQHKHFWFAHVELSVLGEEDPGAAIDELFCDTEGSARHGVGASVLPEFAVPESSAVAAAKAQAIAAVCVSSLEAVALARLLTVGIDTHLAEVAAQMSTARLSVAVVCKPDGSIAGVIADAVLIEQLGRGHANIFMTRAEDVMSLRYTTCLASDSLPEVLAQMHAGGHVHVPIVDADNRPQGVIYARDGLRVLLAAGNFEDTQMHDYVMGVGYR